MNRSKTRTRIAPVYVTPVHKHDMALWKDLEKAKVLLINFEQSRIRRAAVVCNKQEIDKTVRKEVNNVAYGKAAEFAIAVYNRPFQRLLAFCPAYISYDHVNKIGYLYVKIALTDNISNTKAQQIIDEVLRMARNEAYMRIDKRNTIVTYEVQNTKLFTAIDSTMSQHGYTRISETQWQKTFLPLDVG